MADLNPSRGITRRNILSIGSLGFLGLNLTELYRAEAAELGSAGISTATSPIKSCILLYQSGGPSHLDTWDMKPDAPLEVRGEFKSISSSVPGLHVCEHLPRLANIAHRLAIVRSMHHRMRDHNAAATETLCGHTPLEGGDDWDTHYQNFSILRDDLLPKTDQAFSALIEDLEARRLLDSTFIIWIGEFGRSPVVTKAEGGGRDHWPDCFSMVLAGGGVKGGSVYGASDKHGAYPDSDPVSSGDLAATLLWRFGLDPASVIHDRLGRPIHVGGEPVQKLFV